MSPRARTVEDALQGPNHFDSLRLLAALAVMFTHSHGAVLGVQAKDLLWALTGGQSNAGRIGVGVFFVISGFLVAQSFARSIGVVDYLVKRALRLLPALVVLTVATVGCLGPLFTTWSAAEYWSSPKTWRYLANALVYPAIQPLPGVFESRPAPALTNASLWTLGYEASCYLGLAACGLAWRRRWPAALLLALAFAASVVLGRLNPSSMLEFAAWFAAGAALFALRRAVSLHPAAALLAAAVLAGSCVTGQGWSPAFATAGAYLVIWAAFSPVRWPNLARFGDLSYGTYLVGWPVQQALVPFTPTPMANLALAVPLALGLAYLSWWWVEQPLLQRRAAWAARVAAAMPRFGRPRPG